MKKIRAFFGLLAVLSLAAGFSSCNSTGSAAQTAAVAGQQPAAPEPYFTGDGGKGTSIAILAPRAKGLAEDQEYLPALVQREFVSNFSGYSAMEVLDRERLDDQYAELLSGYYDDAAEAGLDLGHLPPPRLISCTGT
jgi:hypothetical protein